MLGIADRQILTGGGGVDQYSGNGDGTFQAPASAATSQFPVYQALVIHNHGKQQDGFVYVEQWTAYNALQGAFTDNYGPADVDVLGEGDVVGNGLDYLAVNTGDQVTLTYPGNLRNHLTSSGFGPILLGDFNGDGKVDLYVSGEMVCGAGDGTFPTYPPLNAGQPMVNIWPVAQGDFNGDGRNDYIAIENAVPVVYLNAN